jgi:septum formation protein
MRLVLASASPRRAELLRAAGYEFETLAMDVDETVRPSESPADYVRRLASEKSARAMERLGPAKAGHYRRESQPASADTSVADTSVVSGFSQTIRPTGVLDVIIIGADTAVVIDGEVLGKPEDDDHAARMLRRLSGRRHEVITGVSVRSQSRELVHVEITAVEFSRLSDADVASYVASGEGRDKAGGYAIQGLASRFIPRIDGSYSNVVGLPVAAVCELLKKISE